MLEVVDTKGWQGPCRGRQRQNARKSTIRGWSVTCSTPGPNHHRISSRGIAWRRNCLDFAVGIERLHDFSSARGGEHLRWEPGHGVDGLWHTIEETLQTSGRAGEHQVKDVNVSFVSARPECGITPCVPTQCAAALDLNVLLVRHDRPREIVRYRWPARARNPCPRERTGASPDQPSPESWGRQGRTARCGGEGSDVGDRDLSVRLRGPRRPHRLVVAEGHRGPGPAG